MFKIVAVTLAVAAAFSLAAGTDAPFSPLSTFYDIDVSTTASFFTGKSFGPGCARGGSIPDGFIAVAMSGATMGVKDSSAICGMCIAIKGPAPMSANPADNTGVVGEYFGYVYEVCDDCTQSAGLQLGIPGAGQNSVVWRAIPCPNATGASAPFLFFDGASGNRARFQVRGLSAPLISAKVADKPLSYDGPFLVLQGADAVNGSVFPFTVDVATALGEQWTIQVPAYREYGPMNDLIAVNKTAPARPTTITAPDALSRFGTGEIMTTSGPQVRTVRTVSQAGRQVVTITTGPRDDLIGGGPMAPSLPQNPMMGPQQSGPMTPRSAHHPSLYAPSLYGAMEQPDNFLGKPLGLDDFGAGRYEQIRVPTGVQNPAFPSHY